MNDNNEVWDELADQPPVESDDVPSVDKPVSSDTPYTQDVEPETVDGVVLPEPIPDDPSPAVPDQVTAVIRTVTPYVVGLILSGLAWVLAKVGLGDVPEGVETWLTGVLPVLLGSLYYVAAKALERRFPSVPWLGSRKRPLYTPAIVAMASTGYVWYKGGKFSPTFRDALVELDKLTPDVPLVVTQGGFNGGRVSASAGTHDLDAVDFSVRGLSTKQIAKAVEMGRKVGIFLSLRTKAQGFSSNHLHGVPNNWGSMSAAARHQIDWTDSRGTKWGYRNGRNGLALNGPDVGPGHVATYRQRTWQGYKTTKNAPAKSSPAPKTKVVVDGKFGPQTIKAVQKWLAVKQDGIFGPVTIKAMQTALNRWGYKAGPVDGKFGPQTVKALQRQTGAVPVDGKFGPVSVKALQNWLNKR